MGFVLHCDNQLCARRRHARFLGYTRSGAINALFSGLAFAGIIYTIVLQRRELEAQRQELSLTLNEMRMQNKTLAQQRFENTLFNLFSLHNELANDLRYRTETGRRIFEYIVNQSFPEILTSSESISTPSPTLILSETYSKAFQQIKPYIQHYLNSLQNIYGLIKQSGQADRLYLNTMKSYISEHEKMFLFYHVRYMPIDNQVIELKQLSKELTLFEAYDINENLLLFLYGERHTM